MRLIKSNLLKKIIIAYSCAISMKANAIICYHNDFLTKIQTFLKAQVDVHALSIAVIRDNKLVTVATFGSQGSSSQIPVNSKTMFQAGSISKPIAAVLALQLSEEGKLDLHKNVNDYLTSWQVKGIKTNKKAVTAAELLSMTGGINIERYNGYSKTAKIPTLLESLNGEYPAKTASVKATMTPGAQYFYSGGGYSIIQQMINDISGKAFQDLAEEKVFIPLNMRFSTYDAPLPKKYLKYAAIGYINGHPIENGWRNYPESAAAGMWSTPSDLAHFCIAINSILAGSHKIDILKRATVVKMLIRQPNSYYGLGFYLDGQGKNMNFSKGGATVGYRSMILMYPYRGDGIIVMTNADSGVKLIRQILDYAVQYYNWPKYNSLDPLS